MDKMLFLRGGMHKEFAFKTLFRENLELIMMDEASSPSLALADYRCLLSDIRSTDEIFDLTLKIRDQLGFAGICSFMNSPIIALGRLSDHLKLDYFSESAAEIISNKLKVREYLRLQGENAPGYSVIGSLDDLKKHANTLGYPFVLKPTDNASSKGVIVVTNESELESAFSFSMQSSFNHELIAEQKIAGDEYCVEVLFVDHVPYFLAISRKYITSGKYCIELMDITPAPIDPFLKRKIESYFTRILHGLNIGNWLLHIEFKITDGSTPVVIEINPRAAGGNLLESLYHLKGFNVYSYLFKILCKKAVKLDELKYLAEKPFNRYSLFYSYITPESQGVIRNIHGTEIIKNELSNLEKFELFYGVGDRLPAPDSNAAFRGCFFLFGDGPDELIGRAKHLEQVLRYDLLAAPKTG